MNDDSAKFYDVLSVPDDWSFLLLGHGERIHKYPYCVIPIGHLDGKPAAVYNQSDIRGVVRASYLDNLDGSVLYDDNLKEKLSGFNFRKDFLFAYARDDVAFYDGAGKVDFFRGVLSDIRLQDTDKSLRLSIAHGSGDKELILDEIRKCVRSFGTINEFVQQWYRNEMDLIKRPVDQLGLGMPKFAAELEQPGTLESLMVDQ